MTYPYDDLTIRKVSRTHLSSNKKREGSFLWFLLLVILIISGISLYLIFFKKDTVTDQKPISPLVATTVKPRVTPLVSNNQKDIIAKLKNLFEGKSGTYSIYVYDLKNESGFGIHEDTSLTAASVNKIPILASLYHQAHKQAVDLEQTITISQNDIQDYGTGIIRYQKPGGVYSIKTLARLMMEKSDNTAAYVLVKYVVPFETIQKFLAEWGLTETDMQNNKTSVKDQAILMEKMFKGDLANIALTKEMMGFMTKTDYEDRLPALLPSNTVVYHKTGDEIGNSHDVGIIDTGNKQYFLGVLTLDFLDGEDSTRQAIAQASKLVFDYITAQK